MRMRKTLVSTERSFSQSDFDRFAQLSGDNNPIHVDPEFSARTRFGRTVAHGLLLASVLRGLIERLVPDGGLSDQALTFTAPTYAGERMLFCAEIADADDSGMTVKLRVMRLDDGVVTCEGRCRVAI